MIAGVVALLVKVLVPSVAGFEIFFIHIRLKMTKFW